MPSAGYSHFYIVLNMVPLIQVCQCPRRAILISTITNRKLCLLFVWCQCPRRAILISTYGQRSFRNYGKLVVSMPSAGYSHFYMVYQNGS